MNRKMKVQDLLIRVEKFVVWMGWKMEHSLYMFSSNTSHCSLAREDYSFRFIEDLVHELTEIA